MHPHAQKSYNSFISMLPCTQIKMCTMQGMHKRTQYSVVVCEYMDVYTQVSSMGIKAMSLLIKLI